MYDVVIIGGGPAGLTAAVYVRRAGRTALILEKTGFGGQIVTSPRVENFPAIAAISGIELGDKLLEQALNQGAEAELETVTRIEDRGQVKVVHTAEGAQYECRAVVIATGARPKRLGLPEEEKFIGSGECFCAVCDGAFFVGKPVAVCGGGNSALGDALMLSEQCSKVFIIHRREDFRGETALVERLSARENVEFVLGSRVVKLEGDTTLESVTVENSEGAKRKIEIEGLFVAIGREPETGDFAELIKLDKNGAAAAGEDCQTMTEGVFVAGDCRAKNVRQLTTAIADGTIAGLAAVEYIDSL